MSWRDEYKRKLVSVEQAASVIKSGELIFCAGGPSAPYDLVNAICDRREELQDVTMLSGIVMYPFAYLKPEFKGHIKHHSLFLGPYERMLLPYGNVEATPYHFSATAYLIKEILKPNVWIVEVSPPDERGFMSYGPIGNFAGDLTREIAHTTIVQVNKKTPYVYGIKGHIHVSQVDYICEKDHDLPRLGQKPPDEISQKIAAEIVDRIPDGATIQLGLGDIANAVGYMLDVKKDLGVYTEMFTDSMMDLVKKGVITCAKKTFRPGKITCSFALGSTELYEFLDHNIMIENMPIYMVNNVLNVARNDNFVAINNTMMVDLTGQACSESVGFRTISGTGGQVDFVRGARLAKEGMSFLALTSTTTTKEGVVSRITCTFPPGTVVTTPRTDVHYVVTEYGAADIYCRSTSERVKALIGIAHPDFRDQLRFEAKKAGLL